MITSSVVESPIATIKCPHCAERSAFLLVRKHVKYSFITFSEEFYATCANCRHDTLLEKDLVDHYRQLGEIMESELTEETYDALVADFANDYGLQALIELRDRANAWACACGEMNPMTFAACWKCHGQAPHDIDVATPKPIKLPNSHPWER